MQCVRNQRVPLTGEDVARHLRRAVDTCNGERR
ncbi:hypothetical protein LMG28140_05261 [Paraburkholderia metrosideri]|jgi:hypothetical protein|uniref:Uncharacterized protein n=1 Tax=Paraburkholderia metrosideri TaxID=580937 RepID=A0ABN7I9Y7_9BURK|nr:hypothetical protein LMG28140_05261 [Paraburkholderia metrosideri]